MQIPWYVFALGAAVVWGLHYPLIDHALKRVSMVSVFTLTLLPLLIVVPLYHKQLATDWAVVQSMDWPTRLPILAIVVTSTAGALLLIASIAGKNATLAALIEISYPVFVVLFAWLLFGEYHLTARVLLGAGLIIAGVLLIISRNP